MAILCAKLCGSLAVRSKSSRRAFLLPPPRSHLGHLGPLSQPKKTHSPGRILVLLTVFTNTLRPLATSAKLEGEAVGRFTRTWQVPGDSYLSKHLEPDPLPKHCQLTAGGVAIQGCPVPGPASMEGRAVHRGNKVSQGLDLVVIHPPLGCRQGH